MNDFWKLFFHPNFDIFMEECGIQQTLIDQSYHYRVDQSYVLHVILQGQGYYEVNNKKHHLRKGQAFILKQNDLVKYYPSKDNPWQYIWLGFSGKGLEEILTCSIINNNYVFDFNNGKKTLKTMFEIVNHNRSHPYDNPEIQLWNKLKIYDFILNLLTEFPSDQHINESINSNDDLALAIYKYISLHYKDYISIDDVANYFSISRSTLFRICKYKYKQSPKEILQEYRMRIASQLLLNTGMTISDIAQNCGYKDAFAFSKYFKKHYGFTPSEFKKLDRQTLNFIYFK